MSSTPSTPRSASPRAGGDDAPSYKFKHPARKVPLTELRREETARFVIFNVENATAADVWELLKAAIPNHCDQIQRVAITTHTSGLRRADLWLRRELGDDMKRSILAALRDGRSPKFRSILRSAFGFRQPESTFPWWWRIDVFRPWRDRQKLDAAAKKQPRAAYRSIMTWNVNGYHSKSEEISICLKEEKVAVCALQETLVSATSKPIRPKGYMVYASPWEEGFRGHAVLVDDRLPSFRIPHDEPWLVHVKISSWDCGEAGTRSLHILAVYMPSGGNFRGKRTAKIKYVSSLAATILKRSPNDLIVGLGDWNMTFTDLNNRLYKARSVLAGIETCGSSRSRWPKNGRPKDLDHFVGGPNTHTLFKAPRVIRKYVVSDHRPVRLECRKEGHVPIPAEKRFGFNLNMIRRHKVQLVNDNRWNAIAPMMPDSEESDEAGSGQRMWEANKVFAQTFDAVCRKHGVKREIIDTELETHLPKSLKQMLNNLHDLERRFAIAAEYRRTEEGKLREEYSRLRQKYRKAKAKWQVRQEHKAYGKIATAMSAHEHKSAWDKVRGLSNPLNPAGENIPMKPSQPLRDEKGELRTSPENIQKVMGDHYRKILTDE
ncbi:Endonuclease/exonuclease/phosphatase, partial [Ganoderma leucocontextum]